MKKSDLEKISLKSPANFFAEYELRELGAVDSEDYLGHLILDKRLYQLRADYYVYVGDLEK